MEENSINKDVLYYMNKLIGLGIEAQRLQDECEEKTGVKICGLGAQIDRYNNVFYIQTSKSIEKVGLPIHYNDGKKYAEINGYLIIEL